tara:strand:- start:53 stop:307 length:255 start_codon:yes stop_codon:yes gene_type:complete
MKITKITYSQTVEANVNGVSVWNKIGVEGELNELDSPEESIEQARLIVKEAHDKAGSFLYPTVNTKVTSEGVMYFNETTRKYEK